MNIGSIENSPLAANAGAVNTPSVAAVGEKGQKQNGQATVSTDTVEISDDAQSLYAKMKAKSGANQKVTNGVPSPNEEEATTPDAGKAAGEMSEEKVENGQVSAAGGEISTEDLKKKIDKLKQKLRTLTAKANGEGNPNVENEIRQLKSKIASYKAQESAA